MAKKKKGREAENQVGRSRSTRSDTLTSKLRRKHHCRSPPAKGASPHRRMLHRQRRKPDPQPSAFSADPAALNGTGTPQGLSPVSRIQPPSRARTAPRHQHRSDAAVAVAFWSRRATRGSRLATLIAPHRAADETRRFAASSRLSRRRRRAGISLPRAHRSPTRERAEQCRENHAAGGGRKRSAAVERAPIGLFSRHAPKPQPFLRQPAHPFGLQAVRPSTWAHDQARELRGFVEWSRGARHRPSRAAWRTNTARPSTSARVPEPASARRQL